MALQDSTIEILVVEVGGKKFSLTLKEKQKETIKSFLKGNDVFCCLPPNPTGYGKSMCYSLLPAIFDRYELRCQSHFSKFLLLIHH